MHKNKAEILLDTHYDSLYKHGYRATPTLDQTTALVKRYPRHRIPGVIRETLAAATIIESGILERANRTGKLYLWDPFCGSGTFLIETLQMFRDEPLKRDHMGFCFEHWPIFDKQEFEQYKQDIFQKILDYELDPNVDIRIIGSDVEVYKDNIEKAEIHKYRYHPNMQRIDGFKDNPMIYSYHYPELNRKHFAQISDYVESEEKGMIASSKNSLITQNSPFFSFYKGDFSTIYAHLKSINTPLSDFTILTNLPYGRQVLPPQKSKKIAKEKSPQNPYKFQQIQDLFRRFGKMVEEVGQETPHIYVVTRKMKHSNPMSFEKFSNVGWDTRMDFVNGGLNVNLLQYNPKKKHKNRETIKAYLME